MIKTLFLSTIFVLMSNAQPSITYTLSMSKPQSHLLEVEITLLDFAAKTVAFQHAGVLWLLTLQSFSDGVQAGVLQCCQFNSCSY